MASMNRKRIFCTPIEGVWSHVWKMPSIPGYKALALLYRESYHVPDGILVQTENGILAHFQSGFVRSIDQRKARAALDAMERWRKQRDAIIAAGETPTPQFDPDKESAEDETNESRD